MSIESLLQDLNLIVGEVGLLLPYAIIAICVGLSVAHFSPLALTLTAVSICFAIMRKTFDANYYSGLFNFDLYLRGMGQSEMITGIAYIYILGIGAFALKKMRATR